ncbi:MAG: hypothetical protein KJ706_07855, partial [Candidatus Omnitrophica bacterium]|nr:hypothetical protein [Candidatus Omnitrophota bacterium]
IVSKSSNVSSNNRINTAINGVRAGPDREKETDSRQNLPALASNMLIFKQPKTLSEEARLSKVVSKAIGGIPRETRLQQKARLSRVLLNIEPKPSESKPVISQKAPPVVPRKTVTAKTRPPRPRKKESLLSRKSVLIPVLIVALVGAIAGMVITYSLNHPQLAAQVSEKVAGLRESWTLLHYKLILSGLASLLISFTLLYSERFRGFVKKVLSKSADLLTRFFTHPLTMRLLLPSAVTSGITALVVYTFFNSFAILPAPILLLLLGASTLLFSSYILGIGVPMFFTKFDFIKREPKVFLANVMKKIYKFLALRNPWESAAKKGDRFTLGGLIRAMDEANGRSTGFRHVFKIVTGGIIGLTIWAILVVILKVDLCALGQIFAKPEIRQFIKPLIGLSIGLSLLTIITAGFRKGLVSKGKDWGTRRGEFTKDVFNIEFKRIDWSAFFWLVRRILPVGFIVAATWYTQHNPVHTLLALLTGFTMINGILAYRSKPSEIINKIIKVHLDLSKKFRLVVRKVFKFIRVSREYATMDNYYNPEIRHPTRRALRWSETSTRLLAIVSFLGVLPLSAGLFIYSLNYNPEYLYKFWPIGGLLLALNFMCFFSILHNLQFLRKAKSRIEEIRHDFDQAKLKETIWHPAIRKEYRKALRVLIITNFLVFSGLAYLYKYTGLFTNNIFLNSVPLVIAIGQFISLAVSSTYSKIVGKISVKTSLGAAGDVIWRIVLSIIKLGIKRLSAFIISGAAILYIAHTASKQIGIGQLDPSLWLDAFVSILASSVHFLLKYAPKLAVWLYRQESLAIAKWGIFKIVFKVEIMGLTTIIGIVKSSKMWRGLLQYVPFYAAAFFLLPNNLDWIQTGPAIITGVIAFVASLFALRKKFNLERSLIALFASTSFIGVASYIASYFGIGTQEIKGLLDMYVKFVGIEKLLITGFISFVGSLLYLLKKTSLKRILIVSGIGLTVVTGYSTLLTLLQPYYGWPELIIASVYAGGMACLINPAKSKARFLVSFISSAIIIPGGAALLNIAGPDIANYLKGFLVDEAGRVTLNTIIAGLMIFTIGLFTFHKKEGKEKNRLTRAAAFLMLLPFILPALSYGIGLAVLAWKNGQDAYAETVKSGVLGLPFIPEISAFIKNLFLKKKRPGILEDKLKGTRSLLKFVQLNEGDKISSNHGIFSLSDEKTLSGVFAPQGSGSECLLDIWENKDIIGNSYVTTEGIILDEKTRRWRRLHITRGSPEGKPFTRPTLRSELNALVKLGFLTKYTSHKEHRFYITDKLRNLTKEELRQIFSLDELKYPSKFPETQKELEKLKLKINAIIHRKDIERKEDDFNSSRLKPKPFGIEREPLDHEEDIKKSPGEIKPKHQNIPVSYAGSQGIGSEGMLKVAALAVGWIVYFFIAWPYLLIRHFTERKPKSDIARPWAFEEYIDSLLQGRKWGRTLVIAALIAVSLLKFDIDGMLKKPPSAFANLNPTSVLVQEDGHRVDVTEEPDFRKYMVRRGDSLFKLALGSYGDIRLWPVIFNDNREKIKDPDLIYINQTIKIRPLSKISPEEIKEILNYKIPKQNLTITSNKTGIQSSASDYTSNINILQSDLAKAFNVKPKGIWANKIDKDEIDFVFAYKAMRKDGTVIGDINPPCGHYMTPIFNPQTKQLIGYFRFDAYYNLADGEIGHVVSKLENRNGGQAYNLGKEIYNKNNEIIGNVKEEGIIDRNGKLVAIFGDDSFVKGTFSILDKVKGDGKSDGYCFVDTFGAPPPEMLPLDRETLLKLVEGSIDTESGVRAIVMWINGFYDESRFEEQSELVGALSDGLLYKSFVFGGDLLRNTENSFLSLYDELNKRLENSGLTLQEWLKTVDPAEKDLAGFYLTLFQHTGQDYGAKEFYKLIALLYGHEKDLYSTKIDYNLLFNDLFVSMKGENINGRQLFEQAEYYRFEDFLKQCTAYNRLHEFMNTIDKDSQKSLLGRFISHIQDSFKPLAPLVTKCLLLGPGSLSEEELLKLRKTAYELASWSGDALGGVPEAVEDSLKKHLSLSGHGSYTGTGSPFVSKTPLPDILGIYLNLKERQVLPVSRYRPTAITKDPPNSIYHSIKEWSKCVSFNEVDEEGNYYWSRGLLQDLLNMKQGQILHSGYKDQSSLQYQTDIKLGNFLQSFGKNKKGIYLSIYDVWDFEIGNGGYFGVNLNPTAMIQTRLMKAIGKPIYFYDRYYLSAGEIKKELERRKSKEKKSGASSEKENNIGFKLPDGAGVIHEGSLVVEGAAQKASDLLKSKAFKRISITAIILGILNPGLLIAGTKTVITAGSLLGPLGIIGILLSGIALVVIVKGQLNLFKQAEEVTDETLLSFDIGEVTPPAARSRSKHGYYLPAKRTFSSEEMRKIIESGYIMVSESGTGAALAIVPAVYIRGDKLKRILPYILKGRLEFIIDGVKTGPLGKTMILKKKVTYLYYKGETHLRLRMELTHNKKIVVQSVMMQPEFIDDALTNVGQVLSNLKVDKLHFQRPIEYKGIYDINVELVDTYNVEFPEQYEYHNGWAMKEARTGGSIGHRGMKYKYGLRHGERVALYLEDGVPVFSMPIHDFEKYRIWIKAGNAPDIKAFVSVHSEVNIHRFKCVYLEKKGDVSGGRLVRSYEEVITENELLSLLKDDGDVIRVEWVTTMTKSPKSTKAIVAKLDFQTSWKGQTPITVWIAKGHRIDGVSALVRLRDLRQKDYERYKGEMKNRESAMRFSDWLQFHEGLERDEYILICQEDGTLAGSYRAGSYRSTRPRPDEIIVMAGKNAILIGLKPSSVAILKKEPYQD